MCSRSSLYLWQSCFWNRIYPSLLSAILLFAGCVFLKKRVRSSCLRWKASRFCKNLQCWIWPRRFGHLFSRWKRTIACSLSCWCRFKWEGHIRNQIFIMRSRDCHSQSDSQNVVFSIESSYSLSNYLVSPFLSLPTVSIAGISCSFSQQTSLKMYTPPSSPTMTILNTLTSISH